MDVFTKREIPNIYSKILYWNKELVLYEEENERDSSLKLHNLHSIQLIPDYFDLELVESNLFNSKTHTQNNLGYAIILNEQFNLDTYLKNQFKNNYRNLKKRHSKLESCFNISYKMFYGDLENEEYHFLMNSLQNMLKKRFEQRKDRHEKLQEWEDLLRLTYNQIIEKKASLFVICENDTPIDISINYHFHKIMFGAISSYDTDYYKFGLGSIEKIKLLEWCLSNSYKILEFGYGDLEYKRLWSNYIYNFKYQVNYNRKSTFTIIAAKLEQLKLYLKEYLKSKKIDVYYNKIKTLDFFKKTFKVRNDLDFTYETIIVEDLDSCGELKKIDDKLESTLPLKLIRNNFLYITKEHKDDVHLLEVIQEPLTFVISGKKNIHKIILSPSEC